MITWLETQAELFGPSSTSHCSLYSTQPQFKKLSLNFTAVNFSLRLTSLSVQQASQEITACDHDRTKQSIPPAPRNITWSNTEVSSVCVKASPVSNSPCGFVDCVLWGMLIRLGGAIPWACRARHMSGDSSKHMWSGLVADWGPDILSSGLH